MVRMPGTKRFFNTGGKPNHRLGYQSGPVVGDDPS
jgi:hypothetical protein